MLTAGATIGQGVIVAAGVVVTKDVAPRTIVEGVFPRSSSRLLYKDIMFWDKAAGLYDLFEMVYNGKVYKGLAMKVSESIEPGDDVLECACGTGMISRHIAPKCHRLIATDVSEGMMKQAKKSCGKFQNVTIRKADIMALEWREGTFDKVVAGNVIHLLDDPHGALAELWRVCKKGGQIIIPTYININTAGRVSFAARALEILGVNFKREFNIDSYKQFFADAGFDEVEYHVVEGRMPCAIARIKK